MSCDTSRSFRTTMFARLRIDALRPSNERVIAHLRGFEFGSMPRAIPISLPRTLELRISRTGRLPGKGLHNRYLTSSIWLSNNCFKSVCCLHELANRYLENPRELRWLDLSYNRIEDIDDDLLKIQSLSILYLHGNRVENMKSIVKLRQLKSLRTLTLHGNPIERKPDYRQYIVAILPQIQNLDFSPVIDYERRRALPPGFYKMVHVE
ncbi:unnamed protein product [Trichogramma brassicae]|uniref:Leucine-rich repeat-containing protein 51 n=1 Tax=Trichogramma brassicae TaxID=86971 RepID=A0A6H5IDJ1_9HYME|nr:unnamed protein product [Trichogramma brassicae]